MKEFKEKVSDAERKTIVKAIEKLRKSIKGNNRDEIMKDIDALQKVSYTLAEGIYEKAGEGRKASFSEEEREQQTGRGGESKDADRGDEEAVDADYEVIDEGEDK
jgi:molecular chaperone DnaK